MQKLLFVAVLLFAVSCASPEERGTGSDSTFENTINSPKGVHDQEDSMGSNSGIDSTLKTDSLLQGQ